MQGLAILLKRNTPGTFLKLFNTLTAPVLLVIKHCCRFKYYILILKNDGHSFLLSRYYFPEQIKELTSCSVRLFFSRLPNKLLEAIRRLMLLDDP